MENQLICLDTSVLIDFFRKKEKTKAYLYHLYKNHELFATSSITVFEIYQGSNTQQKEFWDSFFQSIIILPFDDAAAKISVQVDKQLRIQRKQIDIPDLFIAACAIKNKLPLATLNFKHFQRIENLVLLEKDL